MTLEFHTIPWSSASRIHWALEEIGVPYTKIVHERSAADLKNPEYLALNPNAKVPLLVVDGKPIFESLAILLYLADRFGVEKKLWPAADDPARLEALSWTVWGTVEMAILFSYYLYAPEPQKAGILERIHSTLRILEARLEGRAYQLGDSFSLADVANASAVAWAKSLGIDIGAFPKISAWVDRCVDRPGWRATLA